MNMDEELLSTVKDKCEKARKRAEAARLAAEDASDEHRRLQETVATLETVGQDVVHDAARRDRDV